MAKYKDEIEVVFSARDEQVAAMRKAETRANETERRQARRERESLNRAKKQARQREKIQKESYDRAEKNAAEGGARVANAFESPLLKAALRATAAFGSLELGVGGVNTLIGVMKGDLEGAAEAVKQLPAGIGPFARQLETLLGTVTGISDEINQINSATANLQAASSARAANALADLRNQAGELKRLRDLRQDTELRGIADSTARQRRAEEFRAKNAVADLNAEIEELGRKRTELSSKTLFSTEDQKNIQELKDELDHLEQRRDAYAARARRLSHDPGEDPAVLRYEKEIQRVQRSLDTYDSKRRALRGDIDNIDRQILRAQARLPELLANNAIRAAEVERDIAKKQAEERQAQRDKDLEAEKKARDERVKLQKEAADNQMKFEQDMAKARRQAALDANREQQRQNAEQQTALQDQINQLRSVATASIPRNVAGQNRFLTGVSERSSVNDRAAMSPMLKQLKVMESQLAALKRVESGLDRMEKQISDGPKIVGGIFEGSD